MRVLRFFQILFVLTLLLGKHPSFGQAHNTPEFYLFEDSAKSLTSEAAIELYKKNKFTRVPANEVNIGFTRSIFWLAYQNGQELPTDSLLLYIGHHHINRIHFFFANDSSIKQLWLTGDYFPFSQRPVEATGFYFPIEKKGIYLARVDKANESLQLSFHLISHAEALARESDHKIMMALFTGMILLLTIFGIYLFAISKDKVYIFYILYIASGWLWVLSNAGYAFEYLWPNQPWFASKARPIFALAPLIFSMLFLVKFIGGIRNKKVLLTVKLMNVFLLASIICILLFNQEGYQKSWWFYIQYLTPLVSLLYVLVTLAVLIIATVQGNKPARFYLAAILILLICAILQVSFSVGKLNDFGKFFTYYGVAAGYIIEVVILTAGLVYRFNQYKVEKERILLEMNKRQHENTRIMMEVQSAERSQIANQLHDVAGSLLSAAKLNLSSLREEGTTINEKAGALAANAEQAVSMVSDMLRNLSHSLSPVMLEKVGFKTSLEKAIALFNAPGKINIKLLVLGFEEYKPVLNNYYIAFYSIIFELMNNIVKHSTAKNALVQVTEHDDYFTLVAEDDGTGMQSNGLNEKPTMGMAGIQSKVNYFGGSLAVDKNQPEGLIVTIEIPMNHDAT